MIYDLYFHYRIEKEAGFGKDENGNPCEVYMQLTLGECNTKTREAEKEKQAHVDSVPGIADILCTKPEYITPITLEEYAKNMDEGEGDCCAD